MRHFRLTCTWDLCKDLWTVWSQTCLFMLWTILKLTWPVLESLQSSCFPADARCSVHAYVAKVHSLRQFLKCQFFYILLKWRNMNVYFNLKPLNISFIKMKSKDSILKHILIVLKIGFLASQHRPSDRLATFHMQSQTLHYRIL